MREAVWVEDEMYSEKTETRKKNNRRKKKKKETTACHSFALPFPIVSGRPSQEG